MKDDDYYISVAKQYGPKEYLESLPDDESLIALGKEIVNQEVNSIIEGIFPDDER